MGRSIAGGIVGFIVYILAAGILFSVLAIILGADGIRDPESLEPTMMWLATSIIVGGLVAYIGAAIARAIGKEKTATIIFGVLILIWMAYNVMNMGQAPPEAELPDNPPSWLLALVALGESAAKTPMWSVAVSFLALCAGTYLGGFNKADFAKGPAGPADPAPPGP